MITINIGHGHGLKEGDAITVRVPSNQRWRILMHKLLRLKPPMIERTTLITKATNNTITME